MLPNPTQNDSKDKIHPLLWCALVVLLVCCVVLCVNIAETTFQAINSGVIVTDVRSNLTFLSEQLRGSPDEYYVRWAEGFEDPSKYPLLGENKDDTLFKIEQALRSLGYSDIVYYFLAFLSLLVFLVALFLCVKIIRAFVVLVKTRSESQAFECLELLGSKSKKRNQTLPAETADGSNQSIQTQAQQSED
jgi:hypothetical protein